MHISCGDIPDAYTRYIGRKLAFIALAGAALAAMLLVSVSQGAAGVPLEEVARALLGSGAAKRYELIVWNIRLPQALTAAVSGAGLAVSGAVMQSILRNPLGSPFTLGISHAAAFGAAFAVMIMGSGPMTGAHSGAVNHFKPFMTTTMAFGFSLAAAGVIVAVSRLREASPETMVLTGVALGALFTAGTMFLQFFADDVQLAAMVFWTFGDTGRAGWPELGIMGLVTAAAAVYFLWNGWNYNAVDVGDETAKGLGVRVARVRMAGMLGGLPGDGGDRGLSGGDRLRRPGLPARRAAADRRRPPLPAAGDRPDGRASAALRRHRRSAGPRPPSAAGFRADGASWARRCSSCCSCGGIDGDPECRRRGLRLQRPRMCCGTSASRSAAGTFWRSWDRTVSERRPCCAA